MNKKEFNCWQNTLISYNNRRIPGIIILQLFFTLEIDTNICYFFMTRSKWLFCLQKNEDKIRTPPSQQCKVHIVKPAEPDYKFCCHAAGTGGQGRDFELMRDAGVQVEDPTHAAGSEALHCCEESQVNKPPEREVRVRLDPTKSPVCSSSCQRFKHCRPVGPHIHASPIYTHTHTHTHYSCFTIYRIFTFLSGAS